MVRLRLTVLVVTSPVRLSTSGRSPTESCTSRFSLSTASFASARAFLSSRSFWLNFSQSAATPCRPAGTLPSLRCASWTCTTFGLSRKNWLAAFLFSAICFSTSFTFFASSGRLAGDLLSGDTSTIDHLSTFWSNLTAAKLLSVWLSCALTALKYWLSTRCSAWPQAKASSAARNAAPGVACFVFMCLALLARVGTARLLAVFLLSQPRDRNQVIALLELDQPDALG